MPELSHLEDFRDVSRNALEKVSIELDHNFEYK